MGFMNINPVFLFIIFAMGYVFGLLLKKPTAGKFIIFGFSGLFIYEPVKDAGLLASAVFVFGIILHHVNLLEVFENLPRLKIPRREKTYEPKQPPRQEQTERPKQQQQQQQKNTETAEETHRKYEEHVNRKRAEEAQKQASQPTEDKRSHEEVLGLSGTFTFEDLKKARRREVQRWNPSNMGNKPKHLVQQAEEEMKMINLAFDALKKQFD